MFPDTAYLLVSAATILLRCIVESSILQTKQVCMLKLKAFQKRLQTARDTSGWDLADFCLERCSLPIDQIATAMRATLPESRQQSSSTTENISDGAAAHPESGIVSIQNEALAYPSDFMLPVDAWDIPWENMWDANSGIFPQAF